MVVSFCDLAYFVSRLEVRLGRPRECGYGVRRAFTRGRRAF